MQLNMGLSQFQLVPANPHKPIFMNLNNKLLNYLFPIDSPFTVVSSDYIVTFEVFLANRPVFILELKTPTDINYISTRQLADEHIRRRLGDLGGTSWLHCASSCPIPTLHAVSAMRMRLCFYSVDEHYLNKFCDTCSSFSCFCSCLGPLYV